MHETGTGQQVAQLNERMMMTRKVYLFLLLAYASKSITISEISTQHLSSYPESSINMNICVLLTLKLPTTTIVAQPFNVIKWQLKFNRVA